ncbi:ABC transporter permease subunit [Oceanobacillus neutriphilus]|uniref:ABC transporter permease n=1 Tax=Oceanobacillus neutriphilus TaxID=531815 RepID=A0ABQ2NY00_9BACI|nr:ABC transporter permease subunit [Oceanobacillus neutriphilus]GGP13246.1 ABC transporter permease [Oceanobacillus neutriphilus]
MTFSVKRFMAIFQKDLKDLYRNLYISSTALMPLIFAVIYSRIGEMPLAMHLFVITLSLALVGTFLQCAIIAEEKEKNTLRGLMLSPATLTEIIAGKSAVTIVITVIVTAVSMFIMDFSLSGRGWLIAGILLSLIFFIALGTWMGLITRSVVEASVYILPVMFIFGMANMFIGLADQFSFLQVLEYTPGIQLEEIANLSEAGAGFDELWKPFAIIGAWVVVTLVLTAVTFKKRMMD